MVKEIRYTSIKRVLDELTDHPMLKDVSLEQAIRYTLRFISLHGYPKIYQDRVAEVEIKDFRGVLPCDLISIIQVRDDRSGMCLRSMTDNFSHGMALEAGLEDRPFHRARGNRNMHNLHVHKVGEMQEDGRNVYAVDERSKDDLRKVMARTGAVHVEDIEKWYIPKSHKYTEELAFKTQGRVIYTTFPDGKVTVAYKAIPVDENGYPLLIDDETYIGALEAYIKERVFTVKFDTGKISDKVLSNAKRDYAILAKELQVDFTTPSVSEMEAISRSLNTLIPRVREFDKGFVDLGNREYLKNH